MTKGETIEKKYGALIGRRYETIKKFHDENGWIKCSDVKPDILHIITEVIDLKEIEGEMSWRPKSMDNIENNFANDEI